MSQTVDPTTPPTPPAPPRNGLGTAGFVLGLVGLLFSFVPLIGVIAWPLVVLGLIFGIIGVVRVRSGAATNKGLSIAGIAVSAIGLAVCVLWAVAFGNAAEDLNRDLQRIDEQLDQGVPPTPPNGANPPETEAAGHTVVYEVTGSGKALNISYTTDGMATTEQQQDAPLPFRKELQLPAESFQVFTLTAQNSGGGDITCRITVDGQVLQQATSSGQYSVVTCSGNITSW